MLSVNSVPFLTNILIDWFDPILLKLGLASIDRILFVLTYGDEKCEYFEEQGVGRFIIEVQLLGFLSSKHNFFGGDFDHS